MALYSRATLIAAAAFTLAAQASFAQDAPPPPPGAMAPAAAAGQNTDPPSRVARLNYTAGAVTTEPAGATDWSYAQINRPLTTGDQLWNDQNARAELHIGSTAVRLGPTTSLDILNLDDNVAQLKVAQGSLSTRVRELAPGSSYEIDTPNLALGLNGPGDYRVDVAPDGSNTTVTVRSGSATVYSDNGQVPVAAGQQIRFAGTNLQQTADNGAPGLDGFDQWAASRDAAEDRSVSARYVSRDVPGYQDLDANGTWRSNPQYGEVWVPNAAPVGWAPYHDGHWVWQAPWGWTWVDDAAWGFAPYHYGRWAHVDDAWAWVPGPIVVSQPPVYAPALVAFVGGGGGRGGVDWGVSLAIGGAVAAGVAWFPLGPGEPWHPRWGNSWSPHYYDRVNRTTIVNNRNVNVTNIHNTYINYRAPGGVTAVPATAFVHGQPVGRFAQKVDPGQWRNAQINPGGPGIAPVRQSFGGNLRNANYRPPAAATARAVVATRNPGMPAAYRDNLAQRFAQGGGRVPGAGEPIVHTSVPAHFVGGQGMPAQNVRVVQSHMAGRMPGAAPGAPGVAQQAGTPGQRPGEVAQNGARPVAGAPNGGPGQPGQPPRGEAQARPGVPVANERPQAAPGNGVPRPPQAGGGNPNGANGFAQRGEAAQAGQPAQAAEARRESGGTQPHPPIAQQHGGAEQQVQQQVQRPGVEANRPQPGGMPQQAQRAEPRGVPRPAENPAIAAQARNEPRPAQNQPMPQPAHQPEAQMQRAPEVRAQPQAAPRQEPRPQQAEQAPRQEARPQQAQQAPRQEARPQQAQQAPRQEARPQPQPRPEPRPQQAQQPHPQPQHPEHAEQHSGGGNHDEHHRG